MAPGAMIAGLKKLAKGWVYDVVSIGYPGPVVPMELGHLGLGKRPFEEDLGVRGLERLGRKKWQKRVKAITERFVSILFLDVIVLGGGNAKRLTRLPFRCRIGDTANAFIGGFRLWEKKGKQS